MQARRHLKLAVICTVALAVPAAATTAGVLGQDGSPATKAPLGQDGSPATKAHKIHRDVCPINNPDYTGPKPLPR